MTIFRLPLLYLSSPLCIVTSSLLKINRKLSLQAPQNISKLWTPQTQSRLFTKKRSRMSAPGHQAHQGGKGKVSSKSLSLDGHIVTRPELTVSYIDTHCHLTTTLSMMHQKLQDYSIPENRVDLLAKKLFLPNCKAVVDIHCDIPIGDYHNQALTLKEWPSGFSYYFAAGAHPHVAMHYTDKDHEKFLKIMENPRCVAWGECGLDFFKNAESTHETQRKVFIRQIKAAVSLNKPIVIHTREADDATKEILDEHMPKDYRFHVHCFTSSRVFGNWILEKFPNSFIGITGVATYNLLHIQEFIRSEELPLSRMLMETDSPFMTPKNIYPWLKKNKPTQAKMRYEFSHSGMIPFTADMVAQWINEGRELRDNGLLTTVEEVLEITTKNAEKLYGI